MMVKTTNGLRKDFVIATLITGVKVDGKGHCDNCIVPIITVHRL